MKKLLLFLLLATPAFGQELYSFGHSPRGWPYETTEDKEAFFEFLGNDMGGKGALLVGTSWRDDVFGASDCGGAIPATFSTRAGEAATYGFTPIYIAEWRSGDTLLLNCPSPANTTNDWSNTTSTGLFVDMLEAVITTYKPKYLFIGNEVNSYNGSEYAGFVAFYNANYAALKALNPNTKIGVIFQYEELAGYKAITGGSAAEWSKLTAFDLAKLDVIGLTVYPFFEYTTAAQIPSDYFDDLYTNLGNAYKPLVITEIGWPTEDFYGPGLPPWETNDAAPVTMTGKLSLALQNWPVPVFGYFSLYPLDSSVGGYDMFGSASLYDESDARKPIYDVWIGQATRKRIKGR